MKANRSPAFLILILTLLISCSSAALGKEKTARLLLSVWANSPGHAKQTSRIASLLQSHPILYDVIDKLDLQKAWATDGNPVSKEAVCSDLQKVLDVGRYRDTSLLAVEVTRPDAAEAVRIADALGAAYAEYEEMLARREIEQRIDAIEAELERQAAKVDAAEAALREIDNELGHSVIAYRLRNDEERWAALESDRIRAQAAVAEAKARYERIASLEGDDLAAVAAYVTNDPLFSELRSRRSKASGAERERLQAELDEALAGFKKGTAMAYEVARAKLQALETELTRTEKHADLPEETVQRRTKAERALNIQRSILDALRARVAQESIELEVLRPTVTIVEKARIVR